MIIDISPELDEKTAVWPGDVAFSRSWQMEISQGANLDLSSISTTVHIGAHADAPSHYSGTGGSIDTVSLEPYLGPCQVIEVFGVDLIKPEHISQAKLENGSRLLFKTNSFPNPKKFNENFTALSPEVVDLMGSRGVVLVGLDTPSVDPFDSKDLEAHKKLLHHGIANLEGLLLKDVEEGFYELIALPLKLVGFDASPVRAILRNLPAK